MIKLFSKKPACQDILYVENVFNALLNSYPEIEYKIDNFDVKSELNYESFIDSINHYAKVLSLKIVIEQIEEIDEYIFGFPTVYDLEEKIIDEEYTLCVYLTPFALENLNITFCEILLLLVDAKILRDGYIEFEDDFIEDREFKYRPFLVIAAVYFGFGLPLLKRFWITGHYLFKAREERISLKYYVPLEKDYLIYAQSLMASLSPSNKKDFIQSFMELNKSISTEAKICLSYIEKGRSMFYNSWKTRKSSSFFWAKKG